MMTHARSRSESGNIFVVIIGAVALVASLNYAINLIVTGPLSTSVNLSRIVSTNAQLLSYADSVLTDAVLNLPSNGDADTDNFVEPRPYEASADVPLTGGGALPASLDIDDVDAWGSRVGYCVWNHGVDAGTTTGQTDGSTTPPNILQGAQNTVAEVLVAFVSPGPDRQFQSSCGAFDGSGIDGFDEPAGSDDIALSLSYAEAEEAVGGTVSDIWQIVSMAEVETAKDVSVLSSTPGAGERRVDVSGDGNFIALRTDNVHANSTGFPITLDGPVILAPFETIPEPTGFSPTPLDLSHAGCTNGETMVIRWNATNQRPDVVCP